MDIFVKVAVITSLWLRQTSVFSAPRQARLTLAETMPNYYYTNINGHPGTYSFGYDVADPESGNTQFRTEERYPNGTVVGIYGYVDPFGRPQRYRYVADERGYRVMNDVPKRPVTISSSHMDHVSIESSITWSRPKKQKIEKKLINNFEVNRRHYVNPLKHNMNPVSWREVLPN